jgi:serine/threonine protein kinase
MPQSASNRQKQLHSPVHHRMTVALANNDFQMFDNSYEVKDGVFIHGDIAISSNGVAMRNNARSFDVRLCDLEVKEVIGRGASSFVRRAIHKPTNTVLALKVINIFDDATREQLVEEIRSLYDADCTSVVNFYGAFYSEGSITIALEYMDGGSLANVIQQVRTMPETPLASVAFQTLWGLAYLKCEKRLHRDVKPANILLRSDGAVKLTDFGVSKELKNSVAMGKTFVGTYKYMSPERLRNQAYGYDIDTWALGMVLIECATGQYPGDVGKGGDGGFFSVAGNFMNGAAPSLPQDTEHVKFSPEFRNFVNCCVHPNASHRMPPEILLGHPWFQMNGITNVDSAVAKLHFWIQSLQ